MALRKGDFIESLWLRYALRPPDAVVRVEGQTVRQRIIRNQVEARTEVREGRFEETLREIYRRDGDVHTLDEDYFESAFLKPYEMLIAQPTPVQLHNLTGVEYIGKTRGDSQIILRNSQLPILTLETIEEWWDYQDFRRFVFDPGFYSKHFYNWYRRTVEDEARYVYYDPIWSISPFDRNFEMYLYYYASTVKRLKGWRSPVPIYLIYRKTRPLLYVMFSILILTLNHYERYSAKTRKTAARLSEDYWMLDLIFLQQTVKMHEGISLGFFVAFWEVTDMIVAPLASPIMQFFYGPGARTVPAEIRRDFMQLADKQNKVDFASKTLVKD